MRYPWLAGLLTFACILPAAAAVPIACASSRDDVEQTICADPGLLARDRAIAVALGLLETRCPGARALLVEGQKFWLRERWDCRNQEGAFDMPGKLAACLASRMDERLVQLGTVGPDCNLAPLAAGYKFVDVDYLKRFSDSYLGKPVSVFGWIDLAGCAARHATATEEVVVVGGKGGRDRFRAKFSAMPAERRDYLCAEHPAAHWSGSVQRDRVGNYLLLDDVLGRALPR